MEINIKPFDDRDIEPAYLIHMESFGDESMGYAAFEDEVKGKSRKYFIASIGGIPVGYAGAWNTGTDLSIISIAVRPDYRRQGIAGALIERVKKQAHIDNISAISLEVCEDNEAAIELYKKYGFIITNIRKNYYKNNRSAFIMWLYL